MIPRLSPRQADTLAAIISYKRAHDGCSPSTQDLVHALALHTVSAIHFHLAALQRAGLITLSPGSARSIQVTGATWTPPR